MPDLDLRRLERAASQGDPQAEASLLRAWLRSGALDPELLEFAAYLGDPLACLALGRTAPPALQDLGGWTRGLGRWGRRHVVRAALEAAGLLEDDFDGWVRLLPSAGREVLANAYASAHSWTRSPSARGQERVEARWRRFLGSAGAGLVGVGPQVTAANAVAAATRSVFDADPCRHAALAVTHASKARSPRRIHSAIRAQLMPSLATALAPKAG